MERDLTNISIVSINDDDDIFTRFSITSETFIIISNRIFDLLNGIFGVTLILFIIADSYNYNFFPFEINNANIWLYQIAQIIFITSYWTKNILILRFLLIIGNILFIITFSLKSISIDFLIYASFAITINLKNIFELLYKKRPIIFDKYREQIYQEMFINFMKRDEFAMLTKSSLIRDLQPKSYYCHIGDKCNNLAILLFGKLQVIGKDPDKKIFIEENEFIDSAEWVLRTSNSKKGKRFNYNIVACEKSKYIFWPREILLEKLKDEPEIGAKLLGALGLDISHKVFSHNSYI